MFFLPGYFYLSFKQKLSYSLHVSDIVFDSIYRTYFHFYYLSTPYNMDNSVYPLSFISGHTSQRLGNFPCVFSSFFPSRCQLLGCLWALCVERSLNSPSPCVIPANLADDGESTPGRRISRSKSQFDPPWLLSPHQMPLSPFIPTVFFWSFTPLAGRPEEATAQSHLCFCGHLFTPPHIRLPASHNANRTTLCWPGDSMFLSRNNGGAGNDPSQALLFLNLSEVFFTFGSPSEVELAACQL